MASKWIHCPECGHRLFRLTGGAFEMEIKCPSCKRILPLKEGVNNERAVHGMRVSTSRVPFRMQSIQRMEASDGDTL